MKPSPLFKPRKTKDMHIRFSNDANALLDKVCAGIQSTPSDVIRKCARFILSGKKARRLSKEEKERYLNGQNVVLTIRDVPVFEMDSKAFKATVIARCIDAIKEIDKIPVFKTNLKEGVDYIVREEE